MYLLHDPTATIFWTGFFACMFSIAPLMILLYLPSAKYIKREDHTQREKDLIERINKLQLEVRIHESLAGTYLWNRTTGSGEEKTSS